MPVVLNMQQPLSYAQDGPDCTEARMHVSVFLRKCSANTVDHMGVVTTLSQPIMPSSLGPEAQSMSDYTSISAW